MLCALQVNNWLATYRFINVQSREKYLRPTTEEDAHKNSTWTTPRQWVYIHTRTLSQILMLSSVKALMRRPVYQLREDVWIVTCNRTEGMALLIEYSVGEEEIKLKNVHLLHGVCMYNTDMTLEILYFVLRIWVFRGCRKCHPCPSRELGCCHCILAKHLIYQLLDWVAFSSPIQLQLFHFGWSDTSCRSQFMPLRAAGEFAWEGAATTCGLSLLSQALLCDCFVYCLVLHPYLKFLLVFVSAQDFPQCRESTSYCKIILFLVGICFLQGQLLKCELPGKTKTVTVHSRAQDWSVWVSAYLHLGCEILKAFSMRLNICRKPTAGLPG